MLEKKRDLMAKLLTDVGFKPTIPEGGYFMMADTSDIGKASLIDKPFPCTRIRVDLKSNLKYRPLPKFIICFNAVELHWYKPALKKWQFLYVIILFKLLYIFVNFDL